MPFLRDVPVLAVPEDREADIVAIEAGDELAALEILEHAADFRYVVPCAEAAREPPDGLRRVAVQVDIRRELAEAMLRMDSARARVGDHHLAVVGDPRVEPGTAVAVAYAGLPPAVHRALQRP